MENHARMKQSVLVGIVQMMYAALTVLVLVIVAVIYWRMVFVNAKPAGASLIIAQCAWKIISVE